MPADAAPRPPGPPTWRAPLELRDAMGDSRRYFTTRRAKYGTTFVMTTPRAMPGPTAVVWTSSPAGLRDAFTQATTFVKTSPVYEEMTQSLGAGLLTTEGDIWKAQRRTLQPLFTRRRVDRYADTFVDAATTVVDSWKDGAQIDLAHEMNRVSLQSVGVTLFGTDLTDTILPIVEAVDRLSGNVVIDGLLPIDIPSWVPSKRKRQRVEDEAEVERRVDAIVDAARARLAGAPDEPANDFVTLLLTVEDPETGERLSDVEIREQALVFLLAGYDTTGTAMTFTLWLLARHPEWQSAVRDEARRVLGDRRATAADLGDLELTGRAINEALRLYPSAYISSRSATRDATIDGFHVAEGSVVTTSIWGVHHDADIWPDPERFDPDRFLPDAVKARDSYAWLPFGGGPRSCIGNHFAMLEATLGVASIIRDVELSSDLDDPAVRLGITMRPDEPIRATVSR